MGGGGGGVGARARDKYKKEKENVMGGGWGRRDINDGTKDKVSKFYARKRELFWVDNALMREYRA